MEPSKILEIGSQYSKNDLAVLLDQPSLTTVREGVYSCKNSPSYLLFVDLEKAGKETRFHFDDFFEEDYFHWDSQTTQHIQSPKIQAIVSGELTPHLFVRIKQKEKSKTLPFVYCGRLVFDTHEPNTSKPAHIIFQNLDYDDFTNNQDLLEIYRWKPSTAGKSTKSTITKKGSISSGRKAKYKKPNETERRGLVTSRVGQGYYRQQLIEKWDGKCAVSKSDILPILIASHIVPWSEGNDEERLDVENGILLSPLYDALFDKHLISFDASGRIIVSNSITAENLERLGLSADAKIHITNGMQPYLQRHREKMVDSS
jgi:hypothetical protein